MKYLLFDLLTVIQLSCKPVKKAYIVSIFENEIIDATFFKTIDEPEEALLSWYLYAYGNECDATYFNR